MSSSNQSGGNGGNSNSNQSQQKGQGGQQAPQAPKLSSYEQSVANAFPQATITKDGTVVRK